MLKELEREKAKNLHTMRRLLKGLVPLVEHELSTFEPKCEACFRNKGLLDTCDCGKGK